MTKWEGNIIDYKDSLKKKVMKESNKDAKSMFECSRILKSCMQTIYFSTLQRKVWQSQQGEVGDNCENLEELSGSVERQEDCRY